MNESQLLMDRLRECVEHYYHGRVENAARLAFGAFDAVSMYLASFEVSWSSAEEQAQSLYRLRQVGSMSEIEPAGIFHVPFELRRKVRSQRYSIPGHPCLYLGGSTWICWEELGRPSLDTIHAERFEATTGIRLLDMSFRVRWPLRLSGPGQATVDVAYAVVWPLIAACSVQTSREPDDSFVPEYILPQMLLDWTVHQSRFDGIRFLSTRVPHANRDDHILANIAIPAKISATEGHCQELARSFRWTLPISWEVLARTRAGTRNASGAGIGFPLFPGCNYADTEFWDVDCRLLGLEADQTTR